MNDNPQNDLTVGTIRKAISGLPDDAPVNPVWNSGPPGDADPAVEVCGFHAGTDPDTGTPCLDVRVDIVYLDEYEDDE